MRLGVSAAIVEGVLLAGDLDVEDGRVVEVGLRANGGGGIAVPGFVDLQVNGFGGVDFAEADRDGYRRAGEAPVASAIARRTRPRSLAFVATTSTIRFP